MITSEKPYPENKEELLEECRSLVSRYDLYTLGEPRDSGYASGSWPDGTDVRAGEWQYGVSMIPAQWVTKALELKPQGGDDR